MTSLFFQLLQVAVGTRDRLSRPPSEEEWAELYAHARRQSVTGLCLQALQRDGGLWGEAHGISIDQKLRWIGKGEKIADKNRKLDAQCRQLSAKLAQSNYWHCILKGQGVALLYPHPEWREAGDIDVWVGGGRQMVVDMTRRVTGRREEVTYHHTDFRVFPDTPVEVHFTPTWMFNPLHNHRLQRWFCACHKVRTDTPFPVPTTDFNVLYLLLHIYRHIFDEGIGLRQIVDYFYVLKDYKEMRTGNMATAYGSPDHPTLESLGLQRFAGGLMWVMQDVLGLPREWMIAEPNERVGEWLLQEILEGGNFGYYSQRHKEIAHAHRWQRFRWRLQLSLHRLRLFPGETLWEMPWRTWHYLWRRKHGYL